MKQKTFLCSALIFILLLFCGCDQATKQQSILLDDLNVVLNQSVYQDFLSAGWSSDTEGDPTVLEVTIEESAHYEFTVSMTNGSLTLDEVTFFSEDPKQAKAEWKLLSVSMNPNSNEDFLKKIDLPVDFFSYETAEEFKAYLLDQFNTYTEKEYPDTGNYECGIVLDGCYYGAVFPGEKDEMITVCFNIDDKVNVSKTIMFYKEETSEKTEESEENKFDKVEEEHSFSYKGKTYIVGKNTLGDFLADGWTMVGDYSADFLTETVSAYEIKYIKRDNVVIGPLCFANGNETKRKELKDCTLVKCTIPLNYDMGVDYDNAPVDLPYSLQATMNGDEISEIFVNIGHYGPASEQRDNGVYVALGIVSPYNAGVLLSDDLNTLQYVYMEVNRFYAAEFSR